MKEIIMEDLTKFTKRYINNDHAIELIRLSYAIKSKSNSYFIYDNDPDEDITNYDDIISLFKCHAEKNHKFLCFGEYYKIKLDICSDINLFEIIEHDNIETVHSLYEIFRELGYGFNHQKLCKKQADEVVEAINSYITSREVVSILKKP